MNGLLSQIEVNKKTIQERKDILKNFSSRTYN